MSVFTDLTELEKTMLHNYTHISPCVIEDMPDAHSAWLTVGAQGFCVTPQGCETAEEAEWMRVMLAKALATIVLSTQKEEAL
jgi:hypothetical protein